MNRVKNRTIAALIFAIMICAGLAFYIYSYINHGSEWASFKANKTVYKDNRVITGTIIDRNGVVLASSEDNERTYSDDELTRISTLHVVGDKEGNIGTSLMNKYSSELAGYDAINGSYQMNDDGAILQCTIDAELNKVAYTALNGRCGTVAVYDYTKGDIVCLVSTPSYDPMNVPEDIETNSAYSGAYVNRAISSTYTPGSVQKIITTAAAIENIPDVESELFYCDSAYKVGASIVTCQNDTAHGNINLSTAFAKSCNCTYAQLSLRMGIEVLGKYVDMFGLTSSVTIGNISTAAGSFDTENVEDVDVAWAGIGQATDLVNPIAMMRAVGAIANDGVAVDPKLVCKENPDKTRIISEETALKMQELMMNNVTSNYGQANYPDLIIGAKSGTAEVGDEVTPHAWFTGFIKNENAPLAFVVVIENGGSGSKEAGAVANTVLQAAVERYGK